MATSTTELDTRKAKGLGATNIRWIAAAAEDVALVGVFDLVAIGNAFHRLDPDAVARRLVPHRGGTADPRRCVDDRMRSPKIDAIKASICAA